LPLLLLPCLFNIETFNTISLYSVVDIDSRDHFKNGVNLSEHKSNISDIHKRSNRFQQCVTEWKSEWNWEKEKKRFFDR
jgi:hypothetical protein